MALMSLFVLALVQAITEFLPVSSTGHLIATSEVIGIDSSFAIDVMLHVGTLLALIVYYRKKLMDILRNFLGKKDNRLLINIIISTIPAALVGFFLADFIESETRNITLVSIMLLAVGLVMLFEKFILPEKNNQKIEKLKHSQALGIGVAQSIALIPGTSRSGISIIAGRISGLDNKDAADYAFLIGIPAIAGAAIKVLTTSEAGRWVSEYPFDAFFGIAIAFGFGLIAIDFVLRVVKKVGLKWFGAYRIALAIALLMII